MAESSYREVQSQEVKREIGQREVSHTEVSNRFVTLEDLDAEVEINGAWETIIENITILAKESIRYYELKLHKPWFGKGCSKLLDHRIQAKIAVVTGSK
jgi:hypothetical protein